MHFNLSTIEFDPRAVFNSDTSDSEQGIRAAIIPENLEDGTILDGIVEVVRIVRGNGFDSGAEDCD